MKQTTLGAVLLHTLLGAAALLTTSASARAANPFVAGSHWTGFRVSAIGGGTSNAVLDVANNPSFGVLKVLGQNVPVSIACTQTGVVDLQGLGIPYAGFKVHGMVAPQGGTYSLAANYSIANVPGMHNDNGRLSLLRSYKTTAGTTAPVVVIGTKAGEGLLPPGPCTGAFVNSAGFQGRMTLTHDIPTADPPGEADPPSEFTGDIYMQDFHFRVVGTINPEANTDGSHSIEVLGENVVAGSPFASIKSYGLLLPAVRTNPTSILGNYELIGLLRTGDAGRFQISQ
jgi:hypothetical protein